MRKRARVVLIEDSDWEDPDDDAKSLDAAIVEFPDSVREQIIGMEIDPPRACIIGRAKERSGDR
jgi:hypothetical protein